MSEVPLYPLEGLQPVSPLPTFVSLNSRLESNEEEEEKRRVLSLECWS